MVYKFVDVTKSVSVPVPQGLTPEEEANFIANRIGFVNFEELEAEGRKALHELEEGKLVPFEDVLDELERDEKPENGKAQ